MTVRNNRSELKHLLIEGKLLTQIKNGHLAVGERLTPAYEIAKEYGVSRPTADKAIGNLAARGYVERTPGRGTFVLEWDDVDRGERVANGILIVGRDFDLQWCGPCLQSATQEAEKNGYHVTLSSMGQGLECSVPVAIRNGQAAGTLVIGDLSASQANVLFGEDLPHVIIGNIRSTFGQPSIRYDLGDAGYQITKKLIELDRGPVWLQVQSTIAVQYSQDLLDGYQRAIMECPGQNHHVHITNWGERANDAGVMARQIMAEGQRRFCLIGNYGHVRNVIEQLERMEMDMDPTVVAFRSFTESEWQNAGAFQSGTESEWQKDYVSECNISLAALAAEGVRQIIANSKCGVEVAGKKYKLDIETVDDPGKPLRLSWK